MGVCVGKLRTLSLHDVTSLKMSKGEPLHLPEFGKRHNAILVMSEFKAEDVQI